MTFTLFANLGSLQMWHLVPLVVSVSLVYGATRHELMGPILENAFKFGIWILGFILVIFGILFWVSRGL